MKIKRQAFGSEASIARIKKEAQAFWDIRDYTKFIEVTERAQKLDPTDETLLFNLGSGCTMNYDFPAAQKWFERAICFAENKLGNLMVVGHHWEKRSCYDRALSYYQRALKEPGVTAACLSRIAVVYERLRRLDEARNVAERALHLDDHATDAWLVKAKLDRLDGHFDKAEAALRRITQLAGPGADVHMQAMHELGALYDQQGRYDEAMTTFLQAKTPRSADTIRVKEHAHARVMELLQTMNEETVRRWQEAGKVLQPARKMALLCGYPRSGTTLLEKMLEAHPKVISAEETNLFFDHVYLTMARENPVAPSMLSFLEAPLPDRLRQLRKNYFRYAELYLGEPIGDRVFLDKNPALTVDIPAVVRVLPETKFLVALRDPRDVCLSVFMQPLYGPSTLEETMVDYSRAMTVWFAMKPVLADTSLEVRYEDMVTNFEPTARRAVSFLGLEWDERQNRFNESALAKGVRSQTYAEVTKPLFTSSIGRWKNYQKYFEPHMEKLTPFLQAFNYE